MRAAPDRRELSLLAAAAALSLGVGIVYVVLARHVALAGDELDYDAYGRFAAHGRWFWLTKPYGIAHPSAWKPPGYPAWVGLWYSVLGTEPTRTELVQTLFGPATVALTWLLARRFTDDRRVRLGAAFLVAVYPMAWQYSGLLYPEAIAIPLGLAVLVVALGHEPTVRRAAVVGGLVGMNLLVRPSAFFLLAGVLVAWLAAVGLRRTLTAGAIAVAVAAVVIAPWTVRNAHVMHAFIPLSVQDMAIAGTFNPTSAADPDYPYAWRAVSERDRDLFDPHHPRSEADLRAQLKTRAFSYIREHPASIPKAFFWNGLSRLWDVRRPSRALHEVRFEGRVRGVAIAALAFYYVLAPLALLGLWTLRGRRDLLFGLLATALLASVAFTIDSGTRYRATLEPVIVVLACLGLAWLADRRGPTRSPL
jgi:hypothetical protein